MASSKVDSRYPVGGFQAIYPGTSQKLSVTSSSAQSSALPDGTSIVRLVSSEDCYIEIGTNPTASVTTSLFLPAGLPEYLGVSGNTIKVAAIRGSADGTLYITAGA